MMRIIYFCPSESMYGDNIALLRIMPYLMKGGVVPFFVVSYEGKMTEYLKEHNYNYVVSHCRIWNLYDLNASIKNWFIGGLWRLKHYFANKKAIKQIADKLLTFHADIVHSNSSNSSFGYYLAKELGIKHVWHLREYGKLDANKQFFPSFSLFLHKLDDINNYSISITPLIYDYFHRKKNSVTIYDGVVDETNVPKICIQKDKYFLYVGRLFEKKGIDMIIESFLETQAVNSDYKLLIAGTGDSQYEKYLKCKVLNNGLTDRIVFLGYRQDVASLMGKAKALIVASDFEGFGFITAEAMYAGCYVIGKNTAGTKLQFDNMKRLLGHEVASRFSNKEDLSTILKSITADNISTITYLEETQKKVSLLYGIQTSAHSVMEFYKKILS